LIYTFEDIEKALALHLEQLQNMVLKSAETCKPNLIADYLFELAKKFNTFYNSCPILNQEDEILYSRLLLASKTAETLKVGLSLLGINTVERM